MMIMDYNASRRRENSRVHSPIAGEGEDGVLCTALQAGQRGRRDRVGRRPVRSPQCIEWVRHGCPWTGQRLGAGPPENGAPPARTSAQVGCFLGREICSYRCRLPGVTEPSGTRDEHRLRVNCFRRLDVNPWRGDKSFAGRARGRPAWAGFWIKRTPRRTSKSDPHSTQGPRPRPLKPRGVEE